MKHSGIFQVNEILRALLANTTTDNFYFGTSLFSLACLIGSILCAMNVLFVVTYDRHLSETVPLNAWNCLTGSCRIQSDPRG